MKKCALITFCNSTGPTNYGQVLQCYALYEILMRYNWNVKVIPYREKISKDIIKQKLPFTFLNLLYENWMRVNILKYDSAVRMKKFIGFMKRNVDMAPLCYDIDDVERLTAECSMFIAGSDQIWHPKLVNEFYMLNFGGKEKKRISYATSGIIPEISDFVTDKYKKLGIALNSFDYISLREKTGVEILKKYTHTPIEEVLDPTLLLESKEWDKIASSRIINEPYILCYSLEGINSYKMLLRELKTYYKAEKVVYIKSNLVPDEFPSDFIKIDNAGPEEFLSLIKYSNAICTDSFHGIAFSINYKKQYCLFERLNTNEFSCKNRANALLEKLNLKINKVSSLKDIATISTIDYSEVNKLLEMERKRSLDFLKKAISEG